jgi:hypothetical protein
MQTLGALPEPARQPVLDDLLDLLDRHTLGRHRHHDARQAGTGLANLHRVHRLARLTQLGRQLRQTGRQTGPARIPAELGAKLRVGEQPLDQLPGALGLQLLIGRHG